MLRLFRVIALIEGVSTIMLFLIAMPAKYWMGNPVLVPPVGLTHGVAWLIYVVGMLACLAGQGFTRREWGQTFVVALFPFGTFMNDSLLKRKIAARR